MKLSALALEEPFLPGLGIAIAGHRRHKLARRGCRCPLPGPEDTELKEDAEDLRPGLLGHPSLKGCPLERVLLKRGWRQAACLPSAIYSNDNSRVANP